MRALTVRAVKLSGEDEEKQLSFFENEETKDTKREIAEKTAFEIENRFGTGAVTFGSLMNNEKLPTGGHEDDDE